MDREPVMNREASQQGGLNDKKKCAPVPRPSCDHTGMPQSCTSFMFAPSNLPRQCPSPVRPHGCNVPTSLPSPLPPSARKCSHRDSHGGSGQDASDLSPPRAQMHPGSHPTPCPPIPPLTSGNPHHTYRADLARGRADPRHARYRGADERHVERRWVVRRGIHRLERGRRGGGGATGGAEGERRWQWDRRCGCEGGVGGGRRD